jgi:RimJ/RimL family protein N-acetyltransferase
MAKYRLVKNEKKYWEFIRNLRTMKGVAEGFIAQRDITPKQQEKYMLKYNDCFYICLNEHEPVGYVGIIDDDIRVATHPSYQGKGVGTYMINEIINLNPTAIAKVKVDNQASLKLFESCGFKRKYYILEKE